jgi:prepilin peptidase CpaA
VTALLYAPAGALLIYAALHDLAARTVPNWLSGAVLALGVALRLLDHDLPAGLAVAAGTFAVLFAAWTAGLVGGGDVKLWAATGLLIPPLPRQELNFFLDVVVLGGVLAAIYLALRLFVRRPRGGPPRTAPRAVTLAERVVRAESWRISRGAPLPYACAIAVGAMLTVLPICLSVR